MQDLLNSTLIIYSDITEQLIEQKLSISTMESCTAGLIATLIANRHDSSNIFNHSDVTYSIGAKVDCGVDRSIIDKYGVYSKETAVAMANASKDNNRSNIGIGITGILDLKDDNYGGRVYYAISYNDKIFSHVINIPKEIIGRFQRKLWVANNIGVHLDDWLHEKED